MRRFETETLREKGYFELYGALSPQSARGKKESIYLVTKKTYKLLPNIPYSMLTSFSESEKRVDGSWQYSSRFKERLNLSCYMDLGE